METSQYSNILKAIGSNGATGGLTTQQQADNYSTFSKMMSDGIYLPDLVKKIDTLESKVKELEKPKPNPIDLDLFAVMESAVKEDPDVKRTRRTMQDEKTRVISELCMKDEAFRRATDEYRRAVNTAYVRAKEEQAKNRGGNRLQVCEDTPGTGPSEKGIEACESS